MALDTEKRHRRRQQPAVDRTVRLMAVDAVLGNVTMLIDEWPVLFHVAAAAKLTRAVPLEHFGAG